jgi:processive 1,2-diacylglycerol beta-glucosyltransferase
VKKILILSANRTGYGHASIARALSEQLSLYEDVVTETVDGFSLIGDLAVKASGLYGTVSRYARQIWKISYKSTTRGSNRVVKTLSPLLRERFLDLVQKDPPGLILSVHPFFNGAILNALEGRGLHIPFAVMLADLVDIHPLWAEPRADIVFCPGMDAFFACLSHGVPLEKLYLCDFPTRMAFTEPARTRVKEPYTGNRPLKCLLMAGGDGSGNLRAIANVLLRHFDAEVTVMCGRNKRLRQSLAGALGPYGKRVRLLGFCHNVQEYMADADIALTRAGPNSMMEAIVCCTPLILTGGLPGQEERNPEFAQMRELGVSCTDPKKLAPLLRGLLANNAAGLRHIAVKQRAYRNLDAAKEIAAVLAERTHNT